MKSSSGASCVRSVRSVALEGRSSSSSTVTRNTSATACVLFASVAENTNAPGSSATPSSDTAELGRSQAGSEAKEVRQKPSTLQKRVGTGWWRNAVTSTTIGVTANPTTGSASIVDTSCW